MILPELDRDNLTTENKFNKEVRRRPAWLFSITSMETVSSAIL